jgi:hypothetical protein
MINSSIFIFFDSITSLIVIEELTNIGALFFFQRSIPPFFPFDEKSFVLAMFIYLYASSMQISIVILTDVIFLFSVYHFSHPMGLIFCIKVPLIFPICYFSKFKPFLDSLKFRLEQPVELFRSCHAENCIRKDF